MNCAWNEFQVVSETQLRVEFVARTHGVPEESAEIGIRAAARAWPVMIPRGVVLDDSRTEMGGSRTGVGGSRAAPTGDGVSINGGNVTTTVDAPALRRKPIGGLIGAFKTVSTKQINALRNTPGAVVWQRDFWDHVVRNEEDLYRIRAYIRRHVHL